LAAQVIKGWGKDFMICGDDCPAITNLGVVTNNCVGGDVDKHGCGFLLADSWIIPKARQNARQTNYNFFTITLRLPYDFGATKADRMTGSTARVVGWRVSDLHHWIT
jgi:hypothetical protein